MKEYYNIDVGGKNFITKLDEKEVSVILSFMQKVDNVIDTPLNTKITLLDDIDIESMLNKD